MPEQRHIEFFAFGLWFPLLDAWIVHADAEAFLALRDAGFQFVFLTCGACDSVDIERYIRLEDWLETMNFNISQIQNASKKIEFPDEE